MSGWGSHPVVSKRRPRALPVVRLDHDPVQVSVRVSPELVRAIKTHCVQTDQTMTAFIVAALRAKLQP